MIEVKITVKIIIKERRDAAWVFVMYSEDKPPGAAMAQVDVALAGRDSHCARKPTTSRASMATCTLN